jgi:hypothetical protein
MSNIFLLSIAFRLALRHTQPMRFGGDFPGGKATGA